VLGIDLPWMGEIGRPRTTQHVPVVLSRDEVAALREQVLRSRALWSRDRVVGVAGVGVPFALARKLGRAAESFAWHWLFPAAGLSRDPVSGWCGVTTSIRRPWRVPCATA